MASRDVGYAFNAAVVLVDLLAADSIDTDAILVVITVWSWNRLLRSALEKAVRKNGVGSVVGNDGARTDARVVCVTYLP